MRCSKICDILRYCVCWLLAKMNNTRYQCAIIGETHFVFVFSYVLLILCVFLRIWRWVKFFYAEEEVERVQRRVSRRSTALHPPAYDALSHD